MATSSQQLARLLNLNNDDSVVLSDFISDYMNERSASDTEDDNSDGESSGDETDSDTSLFTPVIPELAEQIVPMSLGRDRANIETATSASGPADSPPCNCSFNDGKPCYLLFSQNDIMDCRMQCAALDRKELDMFILGKIQSGLHSESLTRSTRKSQQQERKKVRLDYFHYGHKICRKMFLHLHVIEKGKLDALISHFRSHGIEARVHKNQKRLPSHSLNYEDARRVVDFILNYAEIHSIQLPGRTPKHWITDARLLPTHITKKIVFDEYVKAANDDERTVKLPTFRKLWQQLTPFVPTMPPASDLCWNCQSLTMKLSLSANKSDAIKITLSDQLKEHHTIVGQERRFYQQCITDVKNQLPQGIAIGRHENCSFDGINHLSFDFAQQLHYPYNPLQPGPVFFKTPRKCGLFGINCEALSKQVNYIIDEAHSCGKGANTVISYLHHYLENFGLGEKRLILHADNCCGQNKNSFVVWYLMWRCLTGRHESIKLCFLITGHTKFSPDAGFGLIKRKFKLTKIDCLADIEHVINISSTMNLCQSVGTANGESDVPVYDWSSFLEKSFNKVKNIKKYHHLEVDNSGILSLKLHSTAEIETQNLLKQQPSATGFPTIVPRNGLSLQRQWYLFKEIRPFVHEDQQDIVSPEPTAAEPQASPRADEQEPPPEQPKSKRPASSSRGRGGKRGRST